ncbi:hypothetical protein [uncultured Cohaesibacter sp.]|uniref:hypothetical protein n=1 Tax=uncultured Cohaesibacter sp. TaxID=1002546 RepID=UPI002AA819BD|nr:hypothetical protein [uncultured Cohaesibacter sp.]
MVHRAVSFWINFEKNISLRADKMQMIQRAPLLGKGLTVKGCSLQLQCVVLLLIVRVQKSVQSECSKIGGLKLCGGADVDKAAMLKIDGGKQSGVFPGRGCGCLWDEVPDGPAF